MRQRKMKSNVLRISCILALVLTMVAAVLLYAFANENSIFKVGLQEANASTSASVQAGQESTNFASDQTQSAQNLKNESYPASFTLKNYNGKDCVTDVKFQNPWSTCWAFGITAASESSVLSKSTQITKDDLDLSERHLAWFTKSHIPAKGEEGYDPVAMNNQSGEGVWYKTEEGYKNRMNGGVSFYGTTSYASGQGVVTEYYQDAQGNIVSFAPYKNDENILIATNKNYEQKTFVGSDCIQQAKDAGYDVSANYSQDGTWSLDESKRFAQSYKLQESNILPSVTPIKKDDGTYERNEAGINAFKKELSQGRGIVFGYASDGNDPGRYINIKENEKGEKVYSHYTWDPNAEANHCVEIVGWDDNYSADNFTFVNPVKQDDAHHNIYTSVETGEWLKNNSSGTPLDPVTGQPVAEVLGYAREHGTNKTTMVSEKELKVYHKLGSGDLSYTDDGTSLKDKDGTAIDSKKIMMVVFKEDGTTAKRDANNHPIYCNWTPDGPGTTEYVNDENGNPIVQGEAITDKVVVEFSYNDVTYKPSGNGAWIVKNSWGAADNEIPNKSDWGTAGSGYFYLSYDDMSVAKPETFDFAVSETEKENVNSYAVYQYDYMTAQELKGDTGSTEKRMANIFPVESNILLKNLSCNTLKPNSTVEYEVYRLNKDYTSPTDGEKVGEAKGTYEFAGYHRVDLDTPIYFEKGDTFSVVAKQYYIADDGSKQYTTVYSESHGEADDENGCYFVGVVNKGESYCSEGSSSSEKWTDWSEKAAQIPDVKSNKRVVDNFPIKAYADLAGSLNVESEGNTFKQGNATTDAVFTFGKNVQGLSADNFDSSKGIEVDDKAVDASNYKVETGSIKLTVFKDYLNTLGVGEHTLRLYLKDSKSSAITGVTGITGLPEYTEATITVTSNDNPGGGGDIGSGDSGKNTTKASTSSSGGSSKTGDNLFPVFVIALLVAASLTVIIVRAYAKRRKQ